MYSKKKRLANLKKARKTLKNRKKYHQTGKRKSIAGFINVSEYIVTTNITSPDGGGFLIFNSSGTYIGYLTYLFIECISVLYGLFNTKKMKKYYDLLAKKDNLSKPINQILKYKELK